MFRIEAKTRILYLPNPQFNDGWENTSTIILKRLMDGQTRTLIRKLNTINTHRFDFKLTNEKAREVLDFFKTFLGQEFKIIAEQHSVQGYIDITAKTITSLQRAYGTVRLQEMFSFGFNITGSIQTEIDTLYEDQESQTPQLLLWIEE